LWTVNFCLANDRFFAVKQPSLKEILDKLKGR